MIRQDSEKAINFLRLLAEMWQSQEQKDAKASAEHKPAVPGAELLTQNDMLDRFGFFGKIGDCLVRVEGNIYTALYEQAKKAGLRIRVF